MAKKTAQGSENCRIEPAERNRYFFGKLLTARDFELEQRYHIEKVRAIHRFIHGTGIVCGLQVEEPRLVDGKLSLTLHPGVGYDCCGRQIVVARQEPVTVQEDSVLEGEGYLYLRYVEVEKEPVPTLPNTGSEEPDCRPSRTLESFEVIFSDESPPAADPAFVFSSEEEDIEARNVDLTGEYYRKRLQQCPECSEPKVFLAAINIPVNRLPLIDEEKTDRFRQLVFSNRMVRDLLLGHLQKFDNPHNTTAEQVGALVSINGIENPGGNVDLVAEDAITLKANEEQHTITVGEKHSLHRDNPHKVTAEQVEALKAINQVENPGKSVELRSSDRSIRIEPQPERKAINLTTAIPAGGQGRIFYGQVAVRIDKDGFVVPDLVTVEDLREGEAFSVILAPVFDGQEVPPFKTPAVTPGRGDNCLYGGLARQNIDRRERTFVAFIPKTKDPDSDEWIYHRKFEIHGIAKDFRSEVLLVTFWVIAGARPARFQVSSPRGSDESQDVATPPKDKGESESANDKKVEEGNQGSTEPKVEDAQAEPPPPPPPTPPREDPIIAYLRQSKKGGTRPQMSNDLGISIADLSARLKELIDQRKVEVRGGRYWLVS